MKGNTGSIDADRCNIFHKRNTDREACPIFLKPRNSINAFQSFNNCFFHNGLNIRWAEQRTLHGVCLCHPEFTVFRNIFFPRDCFCFFKKFIKCDRFKLSCFEKDSLCRTKEHIRLCDSLRIGKKSYFTIFYFADLVSQIKDLTLQHCLHTKMAWCDQFHIFHPSLISLTIFPSKSLIVKTLSSRTA